MWKAIVTDAESRMSRSVETTREALAGIRSGVANAAILQAIDVDAYGSKMKIHDLANVTVPEARSLLIAPYDRGVLGAIEKAILTSELGIAPSNDGTVIRLSIPPLTEERRKDLAKSAGRKVEEGRVAVRNVRRDANEHIKHLEKDKKISEDDSKRAQDEVQKATDKAIEKLDQVLKAKEKEIMQV